MNYRRLALVLALTSALSAPVHAASVVMLQFGSFETMEEAQARLAEVKAKHADILNGIEINVREVKLPPDNLTVYRTQAGPVPTRTAAQSACAKLAGSGDECYVVESAMLTPPASSTPAAVASAAAPAATAPAPAPTPSTSLSSTTSGPATIRIPTLSPSGPLGSNAPAPAPAVPSVADAASVPAPAPSALPPLPPTTQVTPAANLATAPSSSLPIPPDAASLPVAPSPEMQMAMDRAVANQQAAETEAATTSTAPVNNTASANDTNAPANNGARHRSFWSRVNPFSSSGEMSAPPPAPSADTPAIAAPSATVDVAALTPPSPQPMPAIAAQSAPVAPQPIMAPLTPPAPVEPMHLPPPPAPLISAQSDIFNAPTPAPVAPMPPAPMIQAQPLPPQALPPQPLMPQPVFPSFPARPPVPQTSAQITPFKPFPSVPAGGGEIAAANQGNITVEEARRVPLTESTATPLMPMAVQPPVVLYPSATIGQKTLWAQIGQFRDTQSALAFWDSYRQMHPDFPVVRVRVVASFRQGADGPVSLRVGPFARQAFINSLCFTLADQENLRCGSSLDLGIAATTRNTPGYLPGSRYNRQ